LYPKWSSLLSAISARASLSFTSTMEEIDAFAEELSSTVSFLREHS
jgi:cysteine desulfurase/selenocysteine lyase